MEFYGRTQILANCDYITPQEIPRPLDLVMYYNNIFELRLISTHTKEVLLTWKAGNITKLSIASLYWNALSESAAMVAKKMDEMGTPGESSHTGIVGGDLVDQSRNDLAARNRKRLEEIKQSLEDLKSVEYIDATTQSTVDESETGQCTPTTIGTTDVFTDTLPNDPWEQSYLDSVSMSDLRKLCPTQLSKLDDGLRQLLRFVLDHADMYARNISMAPPNYTTGELGTKFAQRLATLLDSVNVRFDNSLKFSECRGEFFQQALPLYLKYTDSDEERMHALRFLAFPAPARSSSALNFPSEECKRAQMKTAATITINLCYWRRIFDPDSNVHSSSLVTSFFLKAFPYN